MITKLIRILVVGLLAWLVWWALGLLLVAIGAPKIIATIVLVIIILCVVAFIAQEFGIGSNLNNRK